MERRSRGIVQRAKDAIEQLRTTKEPPIRAKGWVQHGNLAFWTLQEGEIITYRPIRTLEEVIATLARLECANISKVMDDDQIIAVEWIIDHERAVLGLGHQGDITPRTLQFSVGDEGSLKFACKVSSKKFETDKNGRVPNTLEWSSDTTESFTQAKATYYFLFPFAQEKHAELAPTDTFNFQFTGTDDNDAGVRVRIGGVKFTFIPKTGPNSPLKGEAIIEVPDFEPKHRPRAGTTHF